MLEDLDQVPWAELGHAYGSAEDVPDLLRELPNPDPKVRSRVLDTLYGNVFHQGTRYPATSYVIPFLIEMCADPAVPNRGDLLDFWGSLITGYFSVQERPCWSDGERIYCWGEVTTVEDAVDDEDEDEADAKVLHAIYRESLKGHDLLCELLVSEEASVRAGAAWVMACLPTKADTSIPLLEKQVGVEPSGGVRGAIAFALGELGAAAPLRHLATDDPFAAVRCMATCELARIEPDASLIEPLLHFVSEPIEGYEDIPGAGGESTGDAAFSISLLPNDVQRRAIPAICQQLSQARAFDTMPLVGSLLSAAFTQRDEPLTELTALQRQVLTCMVNTEELWSIGNLMWTLQAYGLPFDRDQCAHLVGINVVNDEALAALRSGLSLSEIGFLEEARDRILEALAIDPEVLDRSPAPDEAWFLCAKAFAETDPERAIEAFRRACSMNPRVASRVDPTWPLADLLSDRLT